MHGRKTSKKAMDRFEISHARILEQVIPARQPSQLGNEKYERVQSEGEFLATYVPSIRDAALVLRIREVEGQFVGRIVEGLFF